MSARKDLTGFRSGRLAVTGFDHSQKLTDGSSRAYWLCRCDCGVTAIIMTSSLKGGRSKSCGCLHREMAPNYRRLNLEGRRFGRLTVLSRAPHVGKRTLWRCACDCGQICDTATQDLRIGHSNSCGCLRQERWHGMVETPTYHSWESMKTRCQNPSHHAYHRYGGAGVKICERWAASFSAFLADMGERPNVKYSLDRYPNNSGNYEPGNCRWATRIEQANNRRTTAMVHFKGEMVSLMDLSRATGTSRAKLLYRMSQGESAEMAASR